MLKLFLPRENETVQDRQARHDARGFILGGMVVFALFAAFLYLSATHPQLASTMAQ